MKKTDFPLKKTFEQDFITESGKTLFTLRYEQATLTEYHEFFYLSQDDQVKAIYTLIRSQLKRTFFEKVLEFFWLHPVYKSESQIDMPLLFKNVVANRFRMYESIYTKKGNKGKSGLYSANLSMVCQKYCLSPHELYAKYTLEQYLWLMDWIIFQANEQSKEGQAENKMALIDKEAIRLRAERTRSLFRTKWFDNQI